MKAVFFYGLFMDPELLQNEGYHPRHMQIACLKHYRLKLGARATLVADARAETWGTIMNLPKEELTRLYAAPSVSDYRPVRVKSTLQNGIEVKSDVYILPADYPLTRASDTNYAKQLIDICYKVGLPKTYQQEIEAMIKQIEE